MSKAIHLVVIAVLALLAASANVNLGTIHWPGPATCPNTSSIMQSEKKLINNTLASTLSQMASKKEFDILDFFKFFFMGPFQDAYKNDVNNLIAFQAIMSDKDPPPSGNPFDLIFKIFLKIIDSLPGVGSEVSVAIELINDGITLITKSGGKHSLGKITWNQFIAERALSYDDAYEGLKDGLWNYTQAFWKSSHLPGTIKHSDHKSRAKLQALLEIVYQNQKTTSEAFIELAADYLNQIRSGVVARIPWNHHNEYFWRLSQVNSNGALTDQLLRLTDSCLDPKTNFKGSDGRAVRIYVAYFPSNVFKPCQRYNSAVFGMNKGSTDDISMCGGVPGKDVTFV